jgi:hypothetical protein
MRLFQKRRPKNFWDFWAGNFNASEKSQKVFAALFSKKRLLGLCGLRQQTVKQAPRLPGIGHDLIAQRLETGEFLLLPQEVPQFHGELRPV